MQNLERYLFPGGHTRRRLGHKSKSRALDPCRLPKRRCFMQGVDYSNFMMQFSKLLGKVDTLIKQQRQIITLLESRGDISPVVTNVYVPGDKNE